MLGGLLLWLRGLRLGALLGHHAGLWHLSAHHAGIHRPIALPARTAGLHRHALLGDARLDLCRLYLGRLHLGLRCRSRLDGRSWSGGGLLCADGRS